MGGRPIVVTDEFFEQHKCQTISEMARILGCSATGLTNIVKQRQPVRWRNITTGALTIPLDWLAEQARSKTEFEIADGLHIKSRILRDYGHAHGIKFKRNQPAYRSASCPCKFETECKRRYWEYGGMMCEVEEVA